MLFFVQNGNLLAWIYREEILYYRQCLEAQGFEIVLASQTGKVSEQKQNQCSTLLPQIQVVA